MALLLLVCWDVIYPIGTCWWAAVVGFRRAVRYRFDRSTTRRLTRLDALNVLFAAVQMPLLPFVTDHPVLVVGHLVAVVVVAAGSILMQRSRVVDETVEPTSGG